MYPKEKETIAYSGPEPFRLYYAMRNLLLDVFELAGKDIFEDKLKWDATGEDKSFFVQWHIDKNMDSWTKLSLAIKFMGSQNSRTRVGNASVSLKPLFITSVKTGFLQKAFWWMYYQMHYKNKRVYEFYRAKTVYNRFKLAVGNVYGIEVEESE
ncbi:MAG: hypothetical protein ACP5E4_03690 [Candidatus Aenigmatarchaeota archaeon]